MSRRENLIIVSLGLLGLIALYGCADNRRVLGAPEVPPGTKPPVITAYFAPSEGMFGYPIRVYLAAEDPEGDMLRIAVQVSQVGYGYYATDWTFLKPQYSRNFVGYLQWNTSSYRTTFMPEWTQITMKVAVLDKHGVQSNEIVLPYLFVSGARPSPLPPAPFDKGDVPRLGYIDVNLFNPLDMGDRGEFFRER
jgi:hypothetical protein